jgi:transposase-like protein
VTVYDVHGDQPPNRDEFMKPYPVEIRKVIYTANAIESLHMQLRKVVKN